MSPFNLSAGFFENFITGSWLKQPVFCPVHAFSLLSTVSLGFSESTLDDDECYLLTRDLTNGVLEFKITSLL